MLQLLKYELTSTSQFLATECKDGISLKKPDKASLSRELVNQLPEEKRNVKCDAQMTVVDFMALVRKLPMKKMGLDTFGQLAENLSNSILAKGSESTRIDIIFDVYKKSSIKQMERAQRSSSEEITITIRSDNQKLPVNLDMFWSSMLNKVRLQEYVYKWMLENVVSEKEIIFGGVYGGECRKLLAGTETQITELSSSQEEADDRIMFHINDSVVKHGVKSVLVDSPDTDVLVNLIFHFKKTWQLQKLFVKLGNRRNKKTVPVHLLVDQLDNNLVLCLRAIHALSGCDSTSKVGPKLSGMKSSMDLSLLAGFGVEELSPQMISNAEKFLVSGLKKTDCSTFDEYRWEQYHNSKKELNFNQLVCCSSTLREHIKRAYLQCRMWLQAPTPEVTKPDPCQYGYRATDPEPAGGNGTILPMLKTLDMSNNPMCNLPSKLFLPLASSPITSLLLRNCSLSQIPQSGSPLEPLSGLELLDLSKNMGLAPDEVHQLLYPLKDGHLTHLSLANNNYGSVPTAALALVSNSLEVLDLHGSAFECLDNSSFPYFPRLLHLNLMYCRIHNIQADTFEGFPVLEVLNLDGNGLITIPTEVLLPSLKVLTLSENPRSTGSGSPETFTMNQVDFGSMTNLTNLTFQEVPLGGVEVSYFNDLSSLVELRLTACKISFIDSFSFVNLSKLEWLYLNENELSVLKDDTFTGLISLIHLDLSHNNIAFRSGINIAMPPRLLFPLQPVRAAIEGEATVYYKLTNKEPMGGRQNGNGGLLENKSGGHGGKEGNGGRLQENARSQKEDEEDKTKGQLSNSEEEIKSTMLKSVPFFLPFRGLNSLRHLDLSSNEAWALVGELWQDLDSLVVLNLASNDIQSWSSPIISGLKNLTELLLAKNSLDEMTEAMVKDFSSESLRVIDLRYNPFKCSCQMKELCNGTLNTSIFVDFTNYQCTKSNEVWMLSEYITNTTCREEIETTSTTLSPKIDNNEESRGGFSLESSIIIMSVLLSVVMTSATLYKKRWYIRYLVHKARATTLVAKEDDQHYLYDTFVCYSQTDRQWVFEHLVARLEGDGRYRVCVHERDFAVGQEITDNIIASIEKSRKVVMVLSPSFVDSSWCMFELQLASNKILDERRNKLILVLLKSLPPHCQPKKLRLLLRTRTYLPWVEDMEGQRLFWAKLMRVVAKPTASEAPIPQDVAATHL
ncbi:hypothetical protein Pmani_011868 [Petrolisthes manimaculis]|uniref:TIR domain-containing protein n=1 Tax=Petrolisthes manimaculis TaxID=1843537 RepID=A0AAE1PYM9_9EUCA|nr:hypothetical protein Pmani_011868 [Petrolisthes manimaculis]